MRRRFAAIAAVAAALMVALAGCTFFTPQATLIPYDASDGVSLNVGKVQVRNAFVISPDGEAANFVGVLINSGTSPADVDIQYTSYADNKAARQTITVPLKANQSLSLGSTKIAQLQFTAINVQPGSLMRIYVTSGGDGKSLLLPVLNGTQQAYRNLTPTPSPTPTQTSTPGRIPADGSTPTPTDTATAGN